MTKDDICLKSACYMRDAVANLEITSLELTEKFIERIERINPTINGYCTTTFDIARESAKKADVRVKNGEKLPPLNGIPGSIKDLNLTKGVRTTFGSMIFAKCMRPWKDED